MTVEIAEQLSLAVSRAQALAPLIEQDAAAAERSGSLTARVADALLESGLFAMVVPSELGGGGVSLPVWMDAVEELARADASTGWVTMAASGSSGLAAAYCGERAVAEMFGGPSLAVVAGQMAPRGLTTPAPDGLRFRGDFSFGSGTAFATWVASGAFVRHNGKVVQRDDGSPDMRAFLVPRDQVTLQGGWDVAGLRATGSFNYAVSDCLVRNDFMFALPNPPRQRGQRFFDLGVPSVSLAGHAAVASGIASRAMREIATLTIDRSRQGQGQTSQNDIFLHDFSLHDAALGAARALAWSAFTAANDQCDEGADFPDLNHQRLRQATTYLTLEAQRVVEFAYQWAGSAALPTASALGRCLRDIRVASQHIFVDETSLTNSGPAILQAWRSNRDLRARTDEQSSSQL